MILTSSMNKVAWYLFSSVLRVRSVTFQRMDCKCLDCAGTYAEDVFVTARCRQYVTKLLRENDKHFNNNDSRALYDFEVIVRQRNRPRGRMERGRVCFSGEHYMYRY